jgi:hypothetical protein
MNVFNFDPELSKVGRRVFKGCYLMEQMLILAWRPERGNVGCVKG